MANEVKIIDNYSATAGKTKTRDYLYSLGQGYGMSNAEIDSLIGWDSTTGEISFGGKKIGRPDSVYDGVSYWSDTSALDNAFNDYIKRSGKAQPYEQAAKTSAAKVQGMTDDLYATQKSDRTAMTERYDKALGYADSNVTESDEYKSAFEKIMPSYNIAAMQGRDNAVASGGASNRGNTHSYAAANAMRQQAAMTAKGQALAHQMGLEAYNARVANVQNILNGLGGYLQNQDVGMQNTIQIAQNESQRLFENDQTEKNNKVDNLVKESAVTGYVPKEWAYSNNPYFNSDGTLNEVYLYEDFDNTGGFTTIINNAKEKLKTTTNATEKANLEATINYATQAKAYKTFNNLKYAPYAHEVSAVIPDRTADYDLVNKQIESAERMALGENNTSLALADKEASSALAQINASKQGNSGAITKDGSATYQNGVKVGDKNGKPILAMDKAIEMYESGNTSDQVTYALSYYGYAGDNTADAAEWEEFYNSFDKTSIQNFLADFVKGNVYDTSGTLARDVWENTLIQGIIDNSEQYDIDVEDARRICLKFGVDTSWLNNYKNRWGINNKKGMKYND